MALRTTALALLAASACWGCRGKEQEQDWSGPPKEQTPTAAPQATAPDRLPPGELLEGEEHAFAMALPRGMKVHDGVKMVTARGPVDFDALCDYVKDRIVARHAEFVPGRLFFPQAQIKGNLDGPFELEILRRETESLLTIRDLTPPPAPPGLSEAERWKRVGLRPGGGLVDPNGME